MDARFCRVAWQLTLLAVLLQLSGLLSEAHSAGYRTTNFVVSAKTPQLAKEIGDTAEMWRRELAIEWLGKELPPWSKPCPIHARVAPNMGAGGATSFIFDRGEVFGWKMNIQGSRERILDSVLPHEITHTIFASHFRQPLPRWADEGACTTVEHRSEVAKQERMLIDFLKTGRGIPFNEMFAMKEYPEDVMPLYAQGHSLAQWMIESRGKKVFLEFLADGLQDENWPRAAKKYYGFGDLYAMQNAWLDWVKQGRPRLSPDASPDVQLASNVRPDSPRVTSDSEQAIYRGQSPDAATPAASAAASDPAHPKAPTLNIVALPNESVYAASAASAHRQRAAGKSLAGTSAESDAPSIYDASHSRSTLRR